MINIQLAISESCVQNNHMKRSESFMLLKTNESLKQSQMIIWQINPVKCDEKISDSCIENDENLVIKVNDRSG